jgi:hypothetical protein
MYIGELMSYVVIDRGRPFLQSGPLATMTGEFYR